MSNVEKTSTAQAPFDDPTSDVTLRSSDGVDFHVFKFILSFVSPVFKDMFTLPQGSQSDIPSVPVILVEENSITLNSLFLLCYPASTPAFNNLEEGKGVLEAAKKHDMGAALSRAADLVMTQFVSTNSLELYALSCKFGWQHHAQTAAAQTLQIKDLGRPSSEFVGLQDITGFDYHRLLFYHYTCGAVAQAVARSLNWLQPSDNNMTMWVCPEETTNSKATYVANLGARAITLWFDEYLVSSGKELLTRPCESTLLESESYERAISNALSCYYCRSTGVAQHMGKFRTLFAAQVKKAVAIVKLSPPRAS
ncbi:hypothetical protein M405DRAFT_932924 [Rhizopogon salebrosus TDB-379]|nr:hypothetical protein M405DRAFT_932924 [Rhizopogon salebrosus TDB-379]